MPDYYPDTIATSVTFSRISNNQVFTSPFSKTIQTYGMSAGIWGATIQHEHLNKTEWQELYGFLVGLRGRAGRFYLKVPQYDESIATGITATTSGTALTLGSAVSALNVGNYISMEHRLRMIVGKTSDTIYTIDEPFNSDYLIATAIELNEPDCLMMLKNDELNMGFTGKYFSDVTVECIEALV